MNKHLLTFNFLLLSILFSEAFAQNFQPFRKGPTYHFISQDSIYSIRVDSAKVVNGDSVFVFNQTVKSFTNNTGVMCVSVPAMVRAEVNLNNQLGHKMIKKPNGDFVFIMADGAEFTLKTRIVTGQNWAFSTNPALTATLTSKAVEAISTVSDSVYTYSLSNGQTIKLSKNYGFLKTPNFAAYTDNVFKAKTLDFHGIPEKGLGQEISNSQKIYDFQAGDEFGYYTFTKKNISGPLCSETWKRVHINSRTDSPNGIIYNSTEDILHIEYGDPNAPAIFCKDRQVTQL